MPRETLRRQLENLHGELAAGEPLDAELRERLREVADDIEQLLSEGSRESDASTAERLRRHVKRATVNFETEHPRLAGILEGLADTLAKLGL
ncbi:MAG TPA: DUF4404 family protein [Gammaproteobacteria bacterium]|jgi:hypothetical protein